MLGCGDKKGAKKKSDDGPKNPLLGRPEPGARGLRRVVDRPKVQNDLKQLYTFYVTYTTEVGRPPRTLEDFTAYIRTDSAVLHGALTDRLYELVVDKKVSGNEILLYESAPDASGIHIVLKGDGSFASMNSKDLKHALGKAP
jgi:hypothetical protein